MWESTTKYETCRNQKAWKYNGLNVDGMYYSIVDLVNANVGIDTSLAEQTVESKSMDLISCTTACSNETLQGFRW